MSARDELARLLDNPEPALSASDATIRRLAVASAHAVPALHGRIAILLANDPDPAVRRECAELLGRIEQPPLASLTAALSDEAAEIREAAATALGEVGDTSPVDQLIALASDDSEDRLAREAAVAALGAIGDERARPVLLELIATAPPQIRRRCVPALSVFDGDDIEEALRSAASDRNPMVREAAEMLVGRQPS
jgi:HEAT repeat protein